MLKNSLMQYLLTALKIFQTRHDTFKYIKWTWHTRSSIYKNMMLYHKQSLP